MSRSIQVEVAYASPTQQELVVVHINEGATAREVIERSGILTRLSDWQFDGGKLGVYSRLVTPDYVVHDRDRIELYRPLLIDPKEARRQRAKKNK